MLISLLLPNSGRAILVLGQPMMSDNINLVGQFHNLVSQMSDNCLSIPSLKLTTCMWFRRKLQHCLPLEHWVAQLAQSLLSLTLASLVEFWQLSLTLKVLKISLLFKSIFFETCYSVLFLPGMLNLLFYGQRNCTCFFIILS